MISRRTSILACSLISPAAIAGGGNLFQPDLYYEVVVGGLDRPTSFEFVGDETLLVLQKNDGRVRVLQGNAIIGDALDLSVSNAGEMGLLGIVRHPEFDSNRLIYLYYTAADTDGGAWIEDRLERYVWDEITKTLSLESSIAVWGAEGWPPSQYHHSGYIRIGPDDKLYVQHGDMYTRTQTMAINDDTGVSGSNACIYRLNLDGSVPADNPFVNHPDLNFQRAYVYGMRNAYGMTFDPLTGHLWYTENGPEMYDEVNLALPGMNSGWHKIMGPDERNAAMNINALQSFDIDDLLMLSGAHYADPVFSYATPVGITFIEFLWNTKFPDYLRSQAITGNVSQAKLFLLPISGDRLGLDVSGGLEDKVADTPEERDTFMIGNGWGPLTDARIGPDGYLYVCGYIRNDIYRIRPIYETLHPYASQVVKGASVSGGFPELGESDDEYQMVRTNRDALTAGRMEVQTQARSPFPMPSRLIIRVESGASRTTRQSILIEKDDGSFHVLSRSAIAVGDSAKSMEILTGVSDYVRDDGTINIRVDWTAGTPLLTARLDLVECEVWR